eukprot:5942071-Amphidinium_carterae.2
MHVSSEAKSSSDSTSSALQVSEVSTDNRAAREASMWRQSTDNHMHHIPAEDLKKLRSSESMHCVIHV